MVGQFVFPVQTSLSEAEENPANVLLSSISLANKDTFSNLISEILGTFVLC